MIFCIIRAAHALERERGGPLFIHIGVAHSNALSAAINWGPDKNKIILNNFPLRMTSAGKR